MLNMNQLINLKNTAQFHVLSRSVSEKCVAYTATAGSRSSHRGVVGRARPPTLFIYIYFFSRLSFARILHSFFILVM